MLAGTILVLLTTNAGGVKRAMILPLTTDVMEDYLVLPSTSAGGWLSMMHTVYTKVSPFLKF